MKHLRLRAPLLAVLALQAILTLTLSNSAYEDEATYLYGGHRLIDDIFHSRPLDDNYDIYFSGLPYLYPMVGAWIDGIGGLAAARAFSLICLLLAGWLLHETTATLFDRRSGLVAAALFGLSAPVLFMGNFATFDAPAVAMLAAAFYCAIRFNDGESASNKAPVFAFFAIALKYVSWVFTVPIVAAEAAVAAAQVGWRKALRRSLLFTLWVGALGVATLLLVARYDSSSILQGITRTTLSRKGGQQPAAEIIAWSTDCVGIVLLLAVAGAITYAAARHTEDGRPRAVRAVLGAALAGSGLLAPLMALRLSSAVSLEKHCGYGLLLAAPMAGWLLARWSRSGRRAWATALTMATVSAAALSGVWVSHQLFARWPDTRALEAYLRPPAGAPTPTMLAETAVLPRYYLYPDPAHAQVYSTFFMLPYPTPSGERLTGLAAYQESIKDRRFDRIVFNYIESPTQNQKLAELLVPYGYRLVRTFPFRDTNYSTEPYHFPVYRGEYEVWDRI